MKDRSTQPPLFDRADPARSLIRVIVAEDNDRIRDLLTALVARQPDLELVGEARDGVEAVRLASEHLPDVIVMDLTMPRMNGIEATAAICKQHPRVRVVAFSSTIDPTAKQAMIDSGAAAFIRKYQPTSDLLEAIRGRGSQSHK